MVGKGGSRHVPRGWPAAVSPPGTEDWEATAADWLLDLLPELREYPTMRQHPIVLAFHARRVLDGALEGDRCGYTRSELGALAPPNVTAAALGEFHAEGQRLSAALRAVELVERALRGK
jgi:hypothetical protein